MSTASLLVGLFSAGLLGVLGWLIKYRDRPELIAGYDPAVVTDEEGLASLVGTSLLGLAALTVVVVALDQATLLDGGLLWTLYSLATVGVVVLLLVQSRQYQKSS